MDAHVRTVREILYSGDQFLVPFFQRHYSWRKENWERLLGDVIALTDQADDIKHFLGPLVCTPLHPVPGEVTPYQLIDGQQRLVTLTVALAALRDIAKLNGRKDLAEEIHEDYLIHRRRQGVHRFKVVPRLGDRTDYEAILEGTPAGTTGTTGMLGAYSFFRREWNRLVARDSNDLIRSYLLATTVRMSLVAITVAGENPYEIFESLNSTGLPLEESDLIRNFLFMKVAIEEQDRFQSLHWEPFERRFEASAGSEKVSPTLFYRCYLMREGNYCRNKAAYVEFKRQNDSRGLTPIAQVEELERFATFEIWLRRPSTCDSSDFRVAFQHIQALDITTAHPLLLHLLDREKRGTLPRTAFLQCLTDLASFVIRRSVCGESTRGYGQKFPSAIKALTLNPLADLRNILLQEGWPDDAAFIPHLVEFPIYKRERNKCRLLLEALERSYGHKEEINLKRLTVEHVMPQSIDSDTLEGGAWQRMLQLDWQDKHEKWVHTLGNLTLTGYNSELGNASFAEKKQAYASSKVSLNQYFDLITEWTDAEIRQRGLDLARKIAQTWPRPTGGPTYIAPTPMIDVFPPDPGPRTPKGRKRLHIRVHWAQLGKALNDEDFCEQKSNLTMAMFLAKLIRVFGDQMAECLSKVPVSREHPLSQNPSVDFLNSVTAKPYSHKLVPGTSLYVFTNTSSSEKREDLRRLVQALGFHSSAVKVSLVD